jgi:hypothetical protein
MVTIKLSEDPTYKVVRIQAEGLGHAFVNPNAIPLFN